MQSEVELESKIIVDILIHPDEETTEEGALAQPVIIEIQGPFHYRNASTVPIGSYVFRHRLIPENYKLVYIDKWVVEKINQHMKEDIKDIITEILTRNNIRIPTVKVDLSS